MNSTTFLESLLSEMPHRPTASQLSVLQKVSSFLSLENPSENLFVLKGFAGTGKTTIIGALVRCIGQTGQKIVLLAPTGRAAKVISEYSKQKAYTIHKHIYYPKTQQAGVQFSLKPNREKDTIYIIDEASMISNMASYDENSVLDDVIHYVYSGKNCRLILVGDTAQLPPVHLEVSPALNEEYLAYNYQKTIDFEELTQVVRQKRKSGILHNATLLRELIADEFADEFLFEIDIYKDIVRLSSGEEIQEAIQTAYDNYGIEQTAFIVRSNKRATQYNKQIRKVILGQEEDLATGDLLMVVKNNYFWLDNTSEAGFIANGDTIEILEIYQYDHLYGFRFAQVKAQMIDYPNQPPFDTVILLDVIDSDKASLSYEENNQLYQALMEEYAHETGYRKYQQIKNNPFFNALQVKYSYAITCHKSQGGQWEVVFIEKPHLPDGVTQGYLRWLYTALTRAKKRIFLINFTDDDFLEDY